LPRRYELYPYLSTVRFLGGEVFVLPGFQELIDDVVATVDRPIISLNTNGTLIDEEG
jgi:MoaA/NifB/PqqE/SkfB family radical SAM enzyme